MIFDLIQKSHCIFFGVNVLLYKNSEYIFMKID